MHNGHRFRSGLDLAQPVISKILAHKSSSFSLFKLPRGLSSTIQTAEPLSPAQARTDFWSAMENFFASGAMTAGISRKPPKKGVGAITTQGRGNLGSDLLPPPPLALVHPPPKVTKKCGPPGGCGWTRAGIGTHRRGQRRHHKNHGSRKSGWRVGYRQGVPDPLSMCSGNRVCGDRRLEGE